ncbi:MAG: carbon-nitrogen hydrolase family protein [Bacteroidota bacterium]
MSSSSELKVALAQVAPVWLNKQQTIQKIEKAILDASKQGAELIVFGEGLLPGYPFWLGLTKATEFDSKMQKEIFAHYVRNSVSIETGELDSICVLAKEKRISVYVGIIERAGDRGGHSLYCSLVYINNAGETKSVHRKLQPTYDERLVWSPGDGNGLQVHSLKDFTLGGLNCWENWMPLPRTALYAQGENVHIAVWPGSKQNTEDITRFIARESRSYVISVSSLMRKEDFPKDTPHLGEILVDAPNVLADGGSCIAGPDGNWIIEPIINEAGIFTATININRVFEERQNFDPVGHYSRPDVTQLSVNRERQGTVKFDS